MRKARWFSTLPGRKAKSSRSDVDVANRRTAPWLWLGLRCRAKNSRMHTTYGHRCNAPWLAASCQNHVQGSHVLDPPREQTENLALGRTSHYLVHGAVVVAGFAAKSKSMHGHQYKAP